jgi:nucleotide-binding universal stress UspA family protein
VLNKLLVPVRGDGKGDNALAHASALAHRFGSHIIVAHCRPRPEDMMPFGVPLPSFVRDQFLAQSQVLANEVEKGMREELHALAARLGLSETDPPHGGTATVAFVEMQGRMVDVIKAHGRLADLIVVPKPERDRNVGSNSLKAALFRTGRPVMMCPDTPEVAPDLGARLTLGWNGSIEASRAVALTMDLIAKATEVTVLAGQGAEPHGATTEDLLEYLALRNIKPEVRRFSAKNPGAALLSETKAAGATMLVMGAYGDSHERETFLGGNTQTVVDDADIPVVMVH